MRQILHISDVHFGPKHVPEVAAGVLATIDERRPDLVVLSGDLTQRAKPYQFRQARAWVDHFPVPSVVVPGNHDVPLYRFWERLFVPFGAYRRWFARDLEPIYRDEEMLVVGVNTAHGWTFKDGRIALKRLAQVEELLAATPESVLKVVVAHHHLIAPPAFDSQRVATHARQALEVFARAGVDLVLSGHQHLSYIGSSEDFYPRGLPPVVIVHTGTTTSNRGRGSERSANTCNWILTDGGTITVSCHRWDPGTTCFREHSRHVYPRQERQPYGLEGLTGTLKP